MSIVAAAIVSRLLLPLYKNVLRASSVARGQIKVQCLLDDLAITATDLQRSRSCHESAKKNVDCQHPLSLDFGSIVSYASVCQTYNG